MNKNRFDFFLAFSWKNVFFCRLCFWLSK